MTSPQTVSTYIPGMYSAKRPDAAEAAGNFIKAWEKKRFEEKPKASIVSELYPAICFSRQIGVGALEIADILAEQLGYRVADKLIIEAMAGNAVLKQQTVNFFDERYPGMLTELGTYLFGEKSFTMGDYMRGLTSVLFALAVSEPTIFVGRGAHLLLPRDRVLSVRVVCSRSFRVKRLARIMKITEDQADRRLKDIDRDQGEFFRKLAGIREPSPDEFDLVINCHYITEPQWAADIVATAFRRKFEA